MPGVSIDVIEDAMDKAGAILRAIEVHYAVQVPPHKEITVIQGADQLIARLKMAHVFYVNMKDDTQKAFDALENDEYRNA